MSLLRRLARQAPMLPTVSASSGAPLRSASSSAAEVISDSATALCVLDPLLLLEPERLRAREQEREAGGSQAYVSLEVSPALLSSVHRGGEMQLGDTDDPQSAWTFGDAAELFQYRFAGSHTVVSGWTCVVSSDVLRAVLDGSQEGREGAGGRWATFSQLTKGRDCLLHAEGVAGGLAVPVLFAGRLLDCPSASVFKLSKAAQLPHGLLVSNDFESVDD
mmetsp:Transcript_3429/g.6256  ORF Transcript_3429/g.6256 Transcript_3429/m.6256 type:complete len:219 (-) Transcript_3429:67-723(-)